MLAKFFGRAINIQYIILQLEGQSQVFTEFGYQFGILGFGAHRRVHKDKAFHMSHDSSLMLTVVDTEEKLKAFLPIVETMVEEGLIVMSDADIIKYAHRATEIIDGRE